ncbi:PAS domain-containing protein [Desulfobacter sp.]
MWKAPFAVANIHLTAEEQRWLDANRNQLILWFDAYYPPIEFLGEHGNFQGLGADIMAAMEKRLSISFIKKPAPNWSEQLNALKNGDIHISPVIVSSKDRAEYAFFSKPYLSIPLVVITQKSRKKANGLDNFDGKRVAVVKGYVSEKYLHNKFDSRFEIVPVSNIAEGLRDTAFGVVDAFVGNLASAAYYIDKNNLPNLRVAGSIGYEHRLSFAVNKKYPLLFSVMQKALHAVPPEEIQNIRDRWILLENKGILSKREKRFLQFALSVTLFLIFILMLIAWCLKNNLKKKVRALHTAEAAIKDQEDRLALAMKATQAAIWDWYPLTGDAFFSDEWFVILGYDPGEVEPSFQGWADLTHPDDLPGTTGILNHYLNKGGTGYYEAQFRMRNKKGEWRWILGKGQAVEWDEEGAVTRITGLNVDIHSQKRVEEALKDSEKKFSELFMLSPDSIALFDLKTEQIIEVNESFLKIFGYERREVLGKTDQALLRYVRPDDREILFKRIHKQEKTTNIEIAFYRSDGEVIRQLISGREVMINGQLVVMIIGRDVTELKKIEQMMIQTEKMVSLGGIAAGIAHEINNPLGIILQAAQNLQIRSRPDFPKNQEAAEELGLDMDLMTKYMRLHKMDAFIEDIKQAAVRAADIIKRMLLFSRKSESRRTVCHLPAIVENALSLVKNDFDLKKTYDFKKISVNMHVERDVPKITCTETEIEQVLLNLFRNAAQAMAEIPVPQPEPRIDIRISKHDNSVCIEIQDNGPGIPDHIKKRVMEPFFTTKGPGIGTGLGLSVSYFIITRGHGGQFTVSSAPGKGTTFTIDLPCK